MVQKIFTHRNELKTRHDKLKWEEKTVMYHTDRRSSWNQEINFSQEKAHTFDFNIDGTLQNLRSLAIVIK